MKFFISLFFILFKTLSVNDGEYEVKCECDNYYYTIL